MAKELFKDKKKGKSKYITIEKLIKMLGEYDKNDVVILEDAEWGAMPLGGVIGSNHVYIPEDEDTGDIYIKEVVNCKPYYFKHYSDAENKKRAVNAVFLTYR